MDGAVYGAALLLPQKKLAFPDETVVQQDDLADVQGQLVAKRALEIAAAGGHKTEIDYWKTDLTESFEGYDYTNSKSDYDFILNGLILGYPIQSTVVLRGGVR